MDGKTVRNSVVDGNLRYRQECEDAYRRLAALRVFVRDELQMLEAAAKTPGCPPAISEFAFGKGAGLRDVLVRL